MIYFDCIFLTLLKYIFETIMITFVYFLFASVNYSNFATYFFFMNRMYRM